MQVTEGTTIVTEAEKVIKLDTPDDAIAVWFAGLFAENDEERSLLWANVGGRTAQNNDINELIQELQIYSRNLGLGTDYFFNIDMWEVFYNKDYNKNSDITGKHEYVFRINPYKMLEVYAKNNNCSVDELCNEMGVTKEKMYYNWGLITRNVAESYKISATESNEILFAINLINDLPDFKGEQKIFGSIESSSSLNVLNPILSASLGLTVEKINIGFTVLPQRSISKIGKTTDIIVEIEDNTLSKIPLMIYAENERGYDASQFKYDSKEFKTLISEIENEIENDCYLLSYYMQSRSPFSFGYVPEDIINVSTDIFE